MCIVKVFSAKMSVKFPSGSQRCQSSPHFLLLNFLFTANFWACVTFSAEFISVTYLISLCQVHGRLTTVSVATVVLPTLLV